jgi:ferric-dicitrate binding protein FerR (iron transport regulator)
VLAVWFVNRLGSPKDLVIRDVPGGVELPDQSRVWLSQGSSATFRAAEDGREVQLNGVAYFEVSQDERRPFRIETAQGLVEVIGTRFEVEASVTDSMRVAVSEGIVKVYNKTRSDSLTLRANEELLIHGQNLERLEPRLQPIALWRLEPVLFSRTPLAEIFATIEGVYGVKFRAENEQVLNCTITFTLTYPTMPVLIQSLETLLSFKITEEGERQYLVSGEGC